MHTMEDQKIDIKINNGIDTNYFINDALRNGLKFRQKRVFNNLFKILLF